jgi:hypothetical protein
LGSGLTFIHCLIPYKMQSSILISLAIPSVYQANVAMLDLTPTFFEIYPADSFCAEVLYARYLRCVEIWSAKNLASCQTPQMKEDPRRDCHGNPRK